MNIINKFNSLTVPYMCDSIESNWINVQKYQLVVQQKKYGNVTLDVSSENFASAKNSV